MIKLQEAHTDTITKLSQDVPATFLNESKEIIRKFKKFKIELDADIAYIIEKNHSCEEEADTQ